MKAGQKLAFNGVQVALFPLENLRITQGVDDPYSHDDTLAIDVNTRGLWDVAFAPFDCKVMFKSVRFNTVVFQSLAPVICADGSKSYVVLGLLHDNNISDIKLGQVFLQGAKIYDEGGAGIDGKLKYAHHIHLTVSKTPVEYGKNPFFWNAKGDLEMKNEVHPADVLFVNDTNIINGLGYNWRKWVAPSLQAGDKVRITGTRYATGQLIPFWVKLRIHTIQQVKNDRALLKEIQSWVYLKDLKKV
jgi:hypothetical protein